MAETHLDYIQIDHKNKIEELSTENHIILVSNLLKLLSLGDDNVGGEINRVFQAILPESKETDILKLIILISTKAKVDNEHLENCLNDIMNRPEHNSIVLTKELAEQISTIIKKVFKRIKKKSKIKSYSQLLEESQKYLQDYKQEDILKRYQIKKSDIKQKNLSYNDIKLYI